jgi:hypothetical protein
LCSFDASWAYALQRRFGQLIGIEPLSRRDIADDFRRGGGFVQEAAGVIVPY